MTLDSVHEPGSQYSMSVVAIHAGVDCAFVSRPVVGQSSHVREACVSFTLNCTNSPPHE